MVILENIYKTYCPGKPEQVQALGGVDLHLKAGEMVAIMGPSGSGKSTLLHILSGLETPEKGTYLFDGVDMLALKDRRRCKIRNQEIGMILQDFGLLDGESALVNAMLPLLIRGTSRKEAKCRAEEALNQLGLGEVAAKNVSRLSGGQRQRVAIARALAAQTRMLLCDEPTGQLDSTTGGKLMAMLKELSRRGICVVVVTHDPAAAAWADRTLHLIDGHFTSP